MKNFSGAFFGLAVLTGCASTSASPEEQFKEEILAAIREEMRDADATKIRFPYNEVFPKSRVACGEVNSTNGFGGFTGFKGFVFDSGVLKFEETNLESYLAARSICISASAKETEAVKVQADQILQSRDNAQK